MKLLDEPVSSHSDEASVKVVSTSCRAYFTSPVLQVTLKAGEKIADNRSHDVFHRSHLEEPVFDWRLAG